MNTMTRALLTVLTGAVAAVGVYTATTVTVDPIGSYLAEVRQVVADTEGVDVHEDNGEFNGIALVGGALHCGMKTDSTFGYDPDDPIGKIANRYCDTVFNDPLTPGEMQQYGVDDYVNSRWGSTTTSDPVPEGDSSIDVATYCDPYTGMMLDGTEC